MVEFFPGIYPWNAAVHIALSMGAVLSELETRWAPLKAYETAGDPGAATAWQNVWRTAADHVAELGERDVANGNDRTAGKKLLRAAMYYLMAERMMRTGTGERAGIYRLGLATFKRGMTLMRERVEFVEVPYGAASLPALFVHARTAPLDGAPGPCIVYLDGFDVNKELLYYGNAVAELIERGISVLILDHPGVGESLRLRNLHAIPRWSAPGTGGVRLCCDARGCRYDARRHHGYQPRRLLRSAFGCVRETLRLLRCVGRLDALQRAHRARAAARFRSRRRHGYARTRPLGVRRGG